MEIIASTSSHCRVSYVQHELEKLSSSSLHEFVIASGFYRSSAAHGEFTNAALRQPSLYASRPRTSNGSTPPAPRIVFASTPRRTIAPTSRNSQVLLNHAILLLNHISSVYSQVVTAPDERLLHDILDYTLLTIGSTLQAALAIHSAHLP